MVADDGLMECTFHLTYVVQDALVFASLFRVFEEQVLLGGCVTVCVASGWHLDTIDTGCVLSVTLPFK